MVYVSGCLPIPVIGKSHVLLASCRVIFTVKDQHLVLSLGHTRSRVTQQIYTKQDLMRLCCQGELQFHSQALSATQTGTVMRYFYNMPNGDPEGMVVDCDALACIRKSPTCFLRLCDDAEVQRLAQGICRKQDYQPQPPAEFDVSVYNFKLQQATLQRIKQHSQKSPAPEPLRFNLVHIKLETFFRHLKQSMHVKQWYELAFAVLELVVHDYSRMKISKTKLLADRHDRQQLVNLQSMSTSQMQHAVRQLREQAYMRLQVDLDIRQLIVMCPHHLLAKSVTIADLSSTMASTVTDSGYACGQQVMAYFHGDYTENTLMQQGWATACILKKNYDGVHYQTSLKPRFLCIHVLCVSDRLCDCCVGPGRTLQRRTDQETG